MVCRCKRAREFLGRSQILGAVVGAPWDHAAAEAIVQPFIGGPVHSLQNPNPAGLPEPVHDQRQGPQPRPLHKDEAGQYEPVGIAVGSFRLFPGTEIKAMYDDNIYASKVDTKADYITSLIPSIDMRSDWNNHMLNFSAIGAAGLYKSHSAENFEDYSVGTNGRVDILRNWNFAGGATFSHRHEERGSPDSTSRAKPTEYDQAHGEVSGFFKLNRMSYGSQFRADNFTYDDNSSNPPGQSSTNPDRDRLEVRQDVKIAYEFIDDNEAWIRAGVNQRSYQRSRDSAGFNRSSNGIEVTCGASLDFGGITRLELFGGFAEQSYRDQRFGAISGPMFGMSGMWNPIVPLVIKPFLQRSIEDSVSPTQVGYVATTPGVSIEFKPVPHISFNARTSYSMNDYTAASVPGASFRSDATFDLGIGAKYWFSESFYVGPSFHRMERTSNTGASDFIRNRGLIITGATF